MVSSRSRSRSRLMKAGRQYSGDEGKTAVAPGARLGIAPKKPASLSRRGPDVRCEALMGRFKNVDHKESERRGRSDGGKNPSRYIGLLLASARILIV